MTTPTRQRPRPPNGAGLLLMFVVVSGVLGMHALDTHGATGSHAVGMTHHASTTASAMGDHSPTARSADQLHSSPEPPVFSASFTVPAPAGHFSSVMALCLGVLAGSVLLLLVRRAQGLPLIDLARRWLTVAQLSTIQGRDRDPPSLTLLAVRRC